MPVPEMRDVQGIVARPYPCPACCYLLFRFADAASGRDFVSRLLPRVTSAESDLNSSGSFCNLGITAAGLQALGVPANVLKEFPLDFSDPPDAKLQGDLGDSAPENWWNKRFVSADVHAVVALFGRSKDLSSPDAQQESEQHLASAAAGVREVAKSTGATEFRVWADRDLQGRSLGDHKLHFGYRDGISQPNVQWDDARVERGVDFRHFVLGYASSDVPSAPRAWDRPSAKQADALARNGSYGVFRVLHQHVAAFNRFLREQSTAAFGGQPNAQELLAAKLMGRWRDGTPLILSPDGPNASLRNSNDFAYGGDPNGAACPVSAHIRVVNPRNQPLNPAEFGEVPRVIRRGMPYGPPLEGEDDDGEPRGLMGLFLCASITRQYYKLSMWMQQNNFSPAFAPNFRTQDFLGNRSVPDASHEFRMPGSGGAKTVSLLDFTRTVGTLLLLFPGLEGLKRLSTGTQA